MLPILRILGLENRIARNFLEAHTVVIYNIWRGNPSVAQVATKSPWNNDFHTHVHQFFQSQTSNNDKSFVVGHMYVCGKPYETPSRLHR